MSAVPLEVFEGHQEVPVKPNVPVWMIEFGIYFAVFFIETDFLCRFRPLSSSVVNWPRIRGAFFCGLVRDCFLPGRHGQRYGLVVVSPLVLREAKR